MGWSSCGVYCKQSRMDRELGPLIHSKLNCYTKFNKMVQTLIHCKQPTTPGARKTSTDTESQKKELNGIYEWFRINRLFLRPEPFSRMPRLSLSFTATTCHIRAGIAPSTLQVNSTTSHRPGEIRDMTKIKSTASSYMSRSPGNRMNLIGQPFDELKVIHTTIKSAQVGLQSHAFPNLLVDHCMSKGNCPHLESPVYSHDLFSLAPQVAAQMVVDKDESFDVLRKLVKSMASPKQVRLCTTPINTTIHSSPPQHQIPVGMSQMSSGSAKSFSQTHFTDINTTTQMTAGEANGRDEGNAAIRGSSNTEQNKRSFSVQSQSSKKWTYSRVMHIRDAQKPQVLLKTTYPREIDNPLSATDTVKGTKKDLCNKDSTAQKHEHGKAPNIGHGTDSGGHVASEKAGRLLISFNLLSTHSLEQSDGQVAPAPVVQTNKKSVPVSRAKSVPVSRSEKKAEQCQCSSHPRKIPSAIAGFRKRRYCRPQTVPVSMARKKTNIINF